MNCPKCNSVNSNDSKFCIVCGEKLTSSTKICKNGHIYDAKFEICPICPSPELTKKINATIHSSPTVAYSDSFNDSSKKTVVNSSSFSFRDSGKKTVIINQQQNESEKGNHPKSRKIVGWLITFSLKNEGND